jgi:hypothetical protein
MEHKKAPTTVIEKNRSPSPPSQPLIRTVSISEYKDAAQCLAEAFAVDEVARYFVDTDDMKSYDEAYKWRLHCDILRYTVAAHCYNGLVTTVGDDYDAVAMWLVHRFSFISC